MDKVENAAVRSKRLDRDELFKKWSDPGWRKEKLEQAEVKSDQRQPLANILEDASPANKDNPSTAVDFLLYNRGFNLYDTQISLSSRMKEFGKWKEEKIDLSKDENSDIALLNAHLDQSYFTAVITGQRTKSLGIMESMYKNLNQLGGILPGNVLNPIRETPFMRAKLFGPAIDFRRIVGEIEFITEETYKLNKDDNEEGERKMETYPEGVVPKLISLDYSDDTLTFQKYRTGLQASYDYLNSSQTRVGRIRNAVEEIAIYHRIALFELITKTIKDALLPGTDYRVDKSASGKVSWTIWRDFVKLFGPMYSPDIMLCKTEESTEWETMSIPTASGSIPVGQLASVTNFGDNPYVLNNVPMIPEYGWYDGQGAGLEDNKFLTFDRDRSSVVVFQRGGDQDETERSPGPQVVTRYLSTKAGAHCPDPNGIRELQTG